MHLRDRCREAIAAFGEGNVVYATKAFLCTAMARLAHEEGLLLDVATGGELYIALAAGVPADRCVLHGNNKSVDELRMALGEGVRQIVVDSFDELDRLEALQAEGLPVPRVQVRVTPGIHAHTHEYVATGQDDSKFGFNLANGDALRRSSGSAQGDFAELVGVHCHIGSNVFEASSFAQAAEVMAEFVQPLGLPELTLGGGLGVAYVAGEEAPTITEWGRRARQGHERPRRPGARRTRPSDRRLRSDHGLHGRHGQADPRHPHVRRRRRRHERQPSPGALRQRLRGPARAGRGRRSHRARCGSSASTARAATC